MIVAISGLLDDMNLLEHPWWIAGMIGIAMVALALVAQTLRRLFK